MHEVYYIYFKESAQLPGTKPELKYLRENFDFQFRNADFLEKKKKNKYEEHIKLKGNIIFIYLLILY